MSKSGDMWQYGIRNLQAFFKNNESTLGKGQNAQQNAVYSNMYKGNQPTDYTECFNKLKTFID